ncbi:MAG: formylmethanofuran dehydrogenase subunit C [Methylotenera sp.]|nr:formylmethanofuran dehydrogenase subunit C [Methylotenera sp.]
MTQLTFTLKLPLSHSLDCTKLTPDLLKGLSINQIASITLNNQLVSALFEITGSDTENIVFINSSRFFDNVGKNMTSGNITLEGDAGAYLGFGLKNGIIHCKGNAQAFAACNMVSGLLKIDGNAGDFLGGASPGLRKGMRGGTVIVKGNAGDRAGDQMRRGLILIEGNAGDYCASRMIAGTIGILGNVGDYACFNMKRGTLMLTKLPKLHASIQDCGMHTLPFLNLMFKSFKPFNTRFSKIETKRVQRFVGDAACNGNGEILLLCHSS